MGRSSGILFQHHQIHVRKLTFSLQSYFCTHHIHYIVRTYIHMYVRGQTMLLLLFSFPGSVNCTDGQSTREVETTGPNQFIITIPGLSPFTQYLCCSTARYSMSTEDASACANVVTRQGSKCHKQQSVTSRQWLDTAILC